MKPRNHRDCEVLAILVPSSCGGVPPVAKPGGGPFLDTCTSASSSCPQAFQSLSPICPFTFTIFCSMSDVLCFLLMRCGSVRGQQELLLDPVCEQPTLPC